MPRPNCQLLFVAALTACCAPTLAEKATPAATLLRIDLPLAGDSDTRLRGRIERAADRLLDDSTNEQRPVLVLEFRSPTDSAAPTPFERALGLARFLVDDRMAGVRTVAFVPETLEGHAVLVALACEELAIGPEADIGSATADDDASKPVELGVRASYEQIASTRQRIPRSVVIAMVDRQATLYRAETDEGVRLLLKEELDALQDQVPVAGAEVISPSGVLVSFAGREARAEGIAQYLTKDRAALGRALGLPAGTLFEDRSLADDWRPIMIDISGPVTRRSLRRFQTLLAEEIAPGGANWVGLRIDSDGGDLDAGLQLAQTLAELDETEVRTVAYVPRRATGVAALAALCCDQLVMQAGAELLGDSVTKQQGGVVVAREEEPAEQDDNEEEVEAEADPDARPMGAERPQNNALASGREELDTAIMTVRNSLAEKAGRSWSLLAATIDSQVSLSRYTNQQTGEVRYMSSAEVAQLPDEVAWTEGETLSATGEALSLPTADAVRLGVAWQEVEQFDEMIALYGFEQAPRTAEPNWALELVEALASPGFAALLLLIGVVGLYIELSTPGLGIGGFISSVAFLLFFWSKFLDGTADWLEVLLFVTGVVFVLMEVVVLPGFGVFGLGGGIMVLVALVLAGQTFLVPKTPSQLNELRDSLAALAAAGVASLVAGLVLRQYLPYAPFFRKAMLMPLDEADRIEQERRETLADFAHLMGQRGVALADLLPGGRAEIAGEIVDVLTRGEMIERGESIEVVETRGSRVVVRRVAG